MKNKQPTHTGVRIILGVGRSPNARTTIKLRETKLHWIDAHSGLKYNKQTGAQAPYNAWNRAWLELETIQPTNGS